MTNNDLPTITTASGAQPNRQTEQFTPERADGLFALAAFVLGFVFMRWVFFSWQGWGVAVFTTLYVCSVSLYLRHKGKSMSQAAWFWMAILLLTGFSFALWQGSSLQPWREFFLFGTAVYWVLSACGMTLLGRTSDWLPLDGLHGLVVIPFRNFALQYRSIAILRRQGKTDRKQLRSVVLGIVLSLIAVVVVLPLLLEADSGGFAALTEGLLGCLQWVNFISPELFIQTLLAIPTAAYIFALVAGSAYRRGNPNYKLEIAERAIESFRILPAVTVFILLGTISGLYLIFIFSQLPYFFSAFVGSRPEGWQVYSEYARNGFFELCGISVINLSLLVGANLSIDKAQRKAWPLKVFNSLLALLTLLLIATAFSKMALYISVYGLSVERLLPCVFMVFLAVVCGAIVARQKREFSIVRTAAVVGSVLFCTFCLINPDGLAANYNANRYLSGTLTDFDVAILYRGGPAGVVPALRVRAETNDQALRDLLDWYLANQLHNAETLRGQPRDTFESAMVRDKLAKRGQ